MLKYNSTLVGKSGWVVDSSGCGAIPETLVSKELELRLISSPPVLDGSWFRSGAFWCFQNWFPQQIILKYRYWEDNVGRLVTERSKVPTSGTSVGLPSALSYKNPMCRYIFSFFVALDLKFPLDLNQEFFSLCPQTKSPSINRASKHLIQSKIQTKRHRLRGGEKASRESQR